MAANVQGLEFRYCKCSCSHFTLYFNQGQVWCISLAGVSSLLEVPEDHLSFQSSGCPGVKLESEQVIKLSHFHCEYIATYISE